MTKATVGMFAAAVLAAGPLCGEIVDAIQRNARESWKKISDCCLQVSALEDEMPNLPESTWNPFRTDQNDQREKIRGIQRRIRSMLLSSDAEDILGKVDRFDEEIAERRTKLASLVEERQFSPEDAESLDQKIADVQAALDELRASRAKALETVRAEFESLGLKCGSSSDVLLKLVDRCEIVDNVIVAKGVCEIVGRLRGVMTTSGDLVSARRYYGVYLTLVDVQILCYEQYLEKVRTGEWKRRLDERERQVKDLAAKARAGSADSRYSAAERAKFSANLANNTKTLQYLEAYRKILASHESVIDRKLAKVKLMRELAANTYGTVANLADLVDDMRASQEDFAAVLELELPELDGFSDTAAQEQLENITRLLD